MMRVLLSVVVVALLGAIGAVVVFAAPNDPAWGSGMMWSGVAGHMAWCDGMGDGAMMHDDLEDVLGLTHAEIHAAHMSGKSLVEIADEQDVDERTLTKAVLDGRRAALDQAVADGRLTRAQADEAYDTLAANISTMLNAKGMGRGIIGGMHGTSPCRG